jgi:nitrogen regulatory protein PII
MTISEVRGFGRQKGHTKCIGDGVRRRFRSQGEAEVVCSDAKFVAGASIPSCGRPRPGKLGTAKSL